MKQATSYQKQLIKNRNNPSKHLNLHLLSQKITLCSFKNKLQFLRRTFSRVQSKNPPLKSDQALVLWAKRFKKLWFLQSLNKISPLSKRLPYKAEFLLQSRRRFQSSKILCKRKVKNWKNLKRSSQ